MRPIPIDILIFVAFFLLNIIVGFRYRGKNQSFKEYAIGDKKFSTATLTATLVATFTSGSVFFAGLENTYSRGLYYILATLIGATAGILITGRVVGPHMGKFLNHVSLPDAPNPAAAELDHQPRAGRHLRPPSRQAVPQPR